MLATTISQLPMIGKTKCAQTGAYCTAVSAHANQLAPHTISLLLHFRLAPIRSDFDWPIVVHAGSYQLTAANDWQDEMCTNGRILHSRRSEERRVGKNYEFCPKSLPNSHNWL